MITNLTIDNFKLFKHLEIEKLGRVNLITGKNNAGKSCLLEAVELYAEKGNPAVIFDILRRRQEIEQKMFDLCIQPPIYINALETEEYTLYMVISSALSKLYRLESQSRVEALGWSDNYLKYKPCILKTIKDEQGLVLYYHGVVRMVGSEYKRRTFVELNAVYNNESIYTYKFDHRGWWSGNIKHGDKHSEYISTNGVDSRLLNSIWSGSIRKELKDVVVQSLGVFGEDIQDITVLKEKTSKDRVLEVVGSTHVGRTPIKKYGDGMLRTFGMAAILCNCENKVLLIDEIDTGLHYSVLLNVWRVVFELSRRLNAQVFATTHSWDCVEAFQQAARELGEDEAYLIRLNKDKEGTYATVFDKEELYVATRENIEVR